MRRVLSSLSAHVTRSPLENIDLTSSKPRARLGPRRLEKLADSLKCERQHGKRLLDRLAFESLRVDVVATLVRACWQVTQSTPPPYRTVEVDCVGPVVMHAVTCKTHGRHDFRA